MERPQSPISEQRPLK